MKFREKAAEIKAAGEAQRGNFTPSGVPLRIYNYWLNNSPSNKAEAIKSGKRRENFCHFWRVVLFWAPLLRFDKAATSKTGLGISLVLLSLTLLWALWLLINTPAILIPVLYAVVGLAGLIGASWGALLLKRRYWNDEWNETFEKVVLNGLLCIACAAMAFIYISLVVMEGLIVLAITAGILVTIGVIVVIGIQLENFLAGRRALAEKREAARTKNMTYDEYMEYRAAQRSPGRFRKFFSGLGDFFLLTFQIVRVKKWKICPIVEVDRS